MKTPVALDVIGCSDIFGRAHAIGLKRLPDMWTLRSFTDTDPVKLAEFGQKYGITRLYHNVQDMLADTEGGAVLVSTPTAAHAEPTIACLNAGRDVLCEKPMAMTLQETDNMLAAARNSGRVLQLCFMSRFAPCWQKVKELLPQIGTPMSATITQYWDSGRELNLNWRHDSAVSGGGIIADSSAHWIDIFRWLFGEINELAAAGIPAPDSPHPDVDDTSFALFKFDCGLLGLLRNSWRHLRCYNEAETVEIYGTEGSIIGNLKTPWTEGGIQTVRLVKKDHTTDFSFNDPMKRFENQLAEFGRLVLAHETAATSALDGRRALQLQQAVYEAMHGSKWVDVR